MGRGSLVWHSRAHNIIQWCMRQLKRRLIFLRPRTISLRGFTTCIKGFHHSILKLLKCSVKAKKNSLLLFMQKMSASLKCGFCFMLVASLFVNRLGKANGQEDNLMVWYEAKDENALCNDYSRAGFFLRRNTSSTKWVIFLESGSLCFSSETCNRRFFRSQVSCLFCLCILLARVAWL